MKKNWQMLATLAASILFVAACGPQEADAPVVEEAPAPAAEGPSPEAIIAEALSAAAPTMQDTVSVADWAGNVHREGSGSHTCLPTPPGMPEGSSPMCMDGPWMAWGAAWGSKSAFTADALGIAYMLAGDGGASNIDPFATGPTEDNAWVVEGPHLMIISPDSAWIDAIPTDPENGGPYVMWKGTDYAHVMVPVDLTDAHTIAGPTDDALSAGTADMATNAKVVDWEGNVLQEGDGPYTCLPTPPLFADGSAPMCMDDEWMAWAKAWSNKTDVSTGAIGISYMLAGDEGGSNTDPFGNAPTDDNEWVVSGPHLMIIVPDQTALADLPTDPANGGPYVMWRDTQYAHVMVPVGE
jgi:hypothetical protein